MSFHDELMGSCDERETVDFVELLYDIGTEQVPRPPWTHPPPVHVLRIAPHQIAHGTLVRNFVTSIQFPHVIQRIQTRTQSGVQAEDGMFDEGREGEVIEEIGEESPYLGRTVLSKAFVVEAVDLGYLTGFVISSEDVDAGGVSYFETY